MDLGFRVWGLKRPQPQLDSAPVEHKGLGV